MLTTIVKIAIDSTNIKILDKYTLRSVNAQNKTNFDKNRPQFGLSAGSGYVEFEDISKEFAEYSRQGLLNTRRPIEICIKNTTTGKEQIVGRYEAFDWNYNSNDCSVSFSLKDDLEDMADIETSGSIKSISVDTRTYANEMLDFLKSMTPPKYVFASISSDISTRLGNIYTNTTFIPSGKLWAKYQDLLELCRLQMTKKRNGELVLLSLE